MTGSASDRDSHGSHRERVAVIGSGVAGLTAAYLLQRRYDVLLFEADSRLGGHAHTHEVADSGRIRSVDSGFIVHNRRTYPHLIRLFDELGVATQPTEMSMSVRCEGCGLEYAGAKGPRGLLATPGQALRPSFVRMLLEVRRFHREARQLLQDTPRPAASGTTLREFLAAGGYSRFFADHFILPLVSAVWSSGRETAERYPAAYLFQFLHHHGMLAVTGSPSWRTVSGGSKTYVDQAVKNLHAVHLSTPVRSLSRTGGGVTIRDDADEVHTVAKVVVATHSDQALRLLADASATETAVLGAIPYSVNETVLHTDARMLPSTRAAYSSWNYLLPSCARGGVAGATGATGATDRAVVTYAMNQLHRLDAPVEYLVTMNAADRIDPAAVIDRMRYEHPVYTPESVAAQARLAELTTGHTAFAGAYHGWGFHEDGCASGVAAAEAFGVTW
ncbi:amine oxidase [Catenulispora acidiphila DSM 44928]|uniref:Amine oxidase n=1 Tax=Catenulispora acidiphila (strain DSM 44928 / JCM 14897 / NBRC 102108 / NRRL B-24433 / ID139908) TaxID=479433 RepID=C7QI88_CATAD|nr:FAD-dependent oxidoreductase [Catenulispora acidiphila]ACU73133.1 amine oxidase [Catenulispora acidiphila DSM 44928]